MPMPPERGSLSVRFCVTLASSAAGSGAAVGIVGASAGVSSALGVSVIGVSALGAVGFNIGQILMAVAMLHTPQLIVTYLPVLMVSGVATGMLTGVVAQMVMKHLKVIEKKA